MKSRTLLFIAYLLALPGLLQAVNPATPREQGMRIKPRKEIATPKDPGMTVVPPSTDKKALKSPPRNIDPKMDDATQAIDSKNQAGRSESQPAK